MGLRAYLLLEYKSGRLPAKALSTVAWRAARAGTHNIGDLGLPPEATHHAAHVRKACGAKADFYYCKLPRRGHQLVRRTIADYPRNLLHEHFASACME